MKLDSVVQMNMIWLCYEFNWFWMSSFRVMNFQSWRKHSALNYEYLDIWPITLEILAIAAGNQSHYALHN